MTYIMLYKVEDEIIMEMVRFDYAELSWLLHYTAFDEKSKKAIFSIIVPMTTTEATKWFDKLRKNKKKEVA